MKKVLIAALIVLITTMSLQVSAGECDTWIPYSQQVLCEYYGQAYGIQPELLEALIEAESAGQMTAKNGSCYGICQINGAVWGYNYTSEASQIRKCCEMLVGFDCEVDEALGRFNGQRNPHYEGYVAKVLNRAHTLEIIHYGN